jgi:hypothetical protein
MKFLNFFLFLCASLFCPPGSGSESSRPKSMIPNTKKDDHLRMEINGDYVREARLHAHFRNKLERDVAASSHLRLLAVRQTRQHACKADRHNFNQGTECSCFCSTAGQQTNRKNSRTLGNRCYLLLTRRFSILVYSFWSRLKMQF